MGMRVYAAGHDIAAGGIKGFIAGQIGADVSDFAVFDQHIRFVSPVGGYDGAVFNYCGHFILPINFVIPVLVTGIHSSDLSPRRHYLLYRTSQAWIPVTSTGMTRG